MISGLACQNSGAEAQHWFECYTSNELYVCLPAPIEWSSIICRYNNIIAQDNTENEIGVPGVLRLPYDEIISTSRMQFGHSVFCSIIGRFSQINWEFPTLLPLRLCLCLFLFSTYRCDMPRSGFMGYFPWSYPRPQMRFGKVASFSGSYGFVPMKWVPQLNDIRISLPEFRGRSPTLILMLYVNELYVYCPSQSSVQDL